MTVLSAIYGASPINNSDATQQDFTADTAGNINIALDDTPGDFATMDDTGFTLHIRYSLSGTWVNDVYSLSAGITESGIFLAGADSSTRVDIDTDVQNTAIEQVDIDLSGAGGYVDTTANKTTWDNAEVHMRQAYSQSKSKDGLYIQVFQAWITGNYTIDASVDDVGTPVAIAPTVAVAATGKGDGLATPAVIAPTVAVDATGAGDGLATHVAITPATAVVATGAGGTGDTGSPVAIAPATALGATGTGDGLATPAAIAPATAVVATGAGTGNGIATPAAITPTVAVAATGSAGTDAVATPAAITPNTHVAYGGGDGLATPAAIAPTVVVDATGLGGGDASATPVAIAPATALGATGTGDGVATPAAITPATALGATSTGGAGATPVAITPATALGATGTGGATAFARPVTPSPIVAAAEIKANFRGDFQGTTFPTDWWYGWNDTDVMGVPAGYDPMEWTGGQWTSDGTAVPTANDAGWALVASSYIHSPTDTSTYTIVRWTVTEAGSYQLVGAWADQSNDLLFGDGVVVSTWINDVISGVEVTTVAFGKATFNRSFSELAVGDTIEIAFRNNTSPGNDSTLVDWNIARVTATGDGVATPAAITPVVAVDATGVGGVGAVDGTATPAAIQPTVAVSATGTGVENVTASPAAIQPTVALGVSSTGGGLASPAAIAPTVAVAATGTAIENATASPAAIQPTVTVDADGTGDGLVAPSTIAPTTALSSSSTGDGLAAPVAITPNVVLAVLLVTGDGLATPAAISPPIIVSGIGGSPQSLVRTIVIARQLSIQLAGTGTRVLLVAADLSMTGSYATLTVDVDAELAAVRE